MSRHTRFLVSSLLLTSACGGPALTQIRCETCPAGQVCDSQTGRCVEATVPDGGCTSNAKCAAPTPFCSSDGRCVGCTSNAGCPQGTCDMRAGRCVAAAAESCGGLSSFIDVTSAALTLRGSTEMSTHDSQLSCGLPGSIGPDVVFGLRLPERRRVSATVKPLSSSPGFQPIVGGRTSCDSSEVACGYFAPERNAASFVTEAAAGPFFVWVDSETNIGGEFELELTFDDSPRVDSCSAPGLLRGGDVIDVTGDTAGLADDVSSSCGGAGAGDAVYRLRLDRARRVRVEATGSLGFRPVVSIRSACSDVATEAACALAVAPTNVALVEVPAAEPGDFFVIVDGAPTNGSGRFNLRIFLSDPVPPPVNDDCSSAAELVLMSGMGRATVQGDTTRAKNDAVGCDGTGPDLVYSVLLSQPATVRAHVTPLAGSRLQPVLYLRRELACMSETISNQLFCTAAGQSGFPGLLEVPRLEPGRYFLFVDGKSNTSGAFDLTFELGAPAAPPANDTCTTATPISLANGPVFLGRETTVGAAPDAHTCADEFLSPDVAYTFSVASRQSLAIDLRALPGSRLLPVLTLKPVGGCAVNALLPIGRCGYSDLQVPDRAVVVLPSLDPGSYSLWVSGDRSTQGPFSLRLSPGPVFSPPMNDTCVSSLTYSLTVGSNVAGDTRAAGNHAQGNCGLPVGANGEAGADVAYLLQLAVPAPSLTITVTPETVGGTLMRPVIYVRGGPQATTCTSVGPNLGCQTAPDYGAPVSLTLTNVQPGTYTLWVDGAGLSAGSFALSIR